MLSGEKFKKEILETRNCDFGFNKRDNKIMLCNTRLCGLCSFSQKNRKVYEPSCSVAKMKWLLSEYKEPVKLTRFEHDVLKHLLEKTQYRFIVREKSDNIYIYKRKPKKGTGAWDISSGMQNLNIFVNLFPFIKWEDSEPTSIEYVLKNCEVIESDL
nr:MAG TPA: hypothetical protein [Caudoviricetes sp.]